MKVDKIIHRFATYREMLDWQISHCPDCGQEANPFTHTCNGQEKDQA